MSIERQHIFSGSIYEELAGYARAVVVNDRIFVSGTVGVDFETGHMAEGPEAQTEAAINTIEVALTEADSSLGDVVRVRVFIPNPDHVSVISSVMKKRFGFTQPANTTVCSPLAVAGADVEVEVEAIRGSEKKSNG